MKPLLKTVLDSLSSGILVCSSSHYLILANKPARRLLSIVTYEPQSELVWNVIPDERIAEFLSETLMSKDNVQDREFELELKDIPKLLNVSVMPLVENRQVTGSLVLVEDITERRNRETKMRLMESLASLTTLASGVAHEIKNPLGSISIHVQLIQKAMDAQEKLCINNHDKKQFECKPNRHFNKINKYLEIVNEEINRLNSIVVDFLFAVRPMNAKLRRGNINTLISEIVEFVSFELEKSGIKCVVNLAENIPPLDFDPDLLKQAFHNLIGNAVNAMAKGGELIISTEDAGGEIRIIIADTGEGIAEENLSKIFEPYFTTKSNGTGLGLTLVYKIIKEHKGEISVRSREGKGSVFILALPIPGVPRRLIGFNEHGIIDNTSGLNLNEELK